MKNRIALKMALCEGRHDIPDAVDGAIFPAVIPDVTDVRGLEVAAEAAIARAAKADLSRLTVLISRVNTIKNRG